MTDTRLDMNTDKTTSHRYVVGDIITICVDTRTYQTETRTVARLTKTQLITDAEERFALSRYSPKSGYEPHGKTRGRLVPNDEVEAYREKHAAHVLASRLTSEVYLTEDLVKDIRQLRNGGWGSAESYKVDAETQTKLLGMLSAFNAQLVEILGKKGGD